MQSRGANGALGPRPLRRWGVLLLGLGLSGCMRLGYDLLSEAAIDAESLDDLTRTASDVTDADGGTELLPIPGRTDFGATPAWTPGTDRAEAHADSHEAWSSFVPLVPASSPPDGGAAPAAGPCQLSGTESVVNGFDASAAGVQARGPDNPTLNWTGSVGSPNPGALEFQNLGTGGGEVYYSGALGDLRGRVMSLNVQVASGAGARVRLFVESGPLRARARAQFSSPPLGQWDCTQVALDAPASAEDGFDPADIVGAGLEIEVSAQVRVYVDQIAY